MTTRGIEAKRVRATAGSVLAFRRILVPIDFSDESTRALEFAAHFGPDEGGNILLVHVVGRIYDIRGYVYGPVQQRRANEVLMRHARQRLQMLGQGYVGEKRHWRCVVRNGTAPRQILEAAEEFHAELIVIPMRGLSHARPTEVGSTAERMVRHASCPVLVLPKQKSRKGRKT